MTGTSPIGWSGNQIIAADFNGDGRTDVFVCPPAGSSATCFAVYSTGNVLTYSNFYPNWAGSALTVGDFDGDGRADIFVCPPVGSGGACFAMYSTGNGFSYGNSTFYPQWAGSTLTAGDFNGDGRTDIFVCPPVGSGGACFAMYSTGNGFSLRQQ